MYYKLYLHKNTHRILYLTNLGIHANDPIEDVYVDRTQRITRSLQAAKGMRYGTRRGTIESPNPYVYVDEFFVMLPV